METAVRRPAATVSTRARQPWKLLLLGVCLACGVVLLFACDPAASAIFPPCPFRALTGLRCPGCGTLRGLHQLLHGNLIAALRLNPLMVLSLPFLAYGLLDEVVYRARGYRLLRAQCGAGPVWLLLALILAFWVLRNIPCYPFSLVAG